MNRKRLIILLLSIAAIAAAAVWFGLYHWPKEKENEGLSTNGSGYAEEEIPHADPLIVGKWQNDLNPQWFRVYYDDYDDDGFFWGKEWNEADDVSEEDLNYHGNGWFRWRVDGKQLLEMHTMDIVDVPVSKRWKVHKPSLPDSLILTDAEHRKHCLHFGRVQ